MPAHANHPALNSEFLMKLFATGYSAFAIVAFFIIVQYIFKLDFTCPCQPYYKKIACLVYMAWPCLILCFLLMMMDPQFMKICRGECSFVHCCMFFLRSFSAGLLWVITALINGDWFVCLRSINPKEQLSCKDQKD